MARKRKGTAKTQDQMVPSLRKSSNAFYAKTDTGLRAPGAKPLMDSGEPPVVPQRAARPSVPQGAFARLKGYISVAQEGYDELVRAIIRPPRAQYSVSDLGPSEFR